MGTEAKILSTSSRQAVQYMDIGQDDNILWLHNSQIHVTNITMYSHNDYKSNCKEGKQSLKIPMPSLELRAMIMTTK